MKIKKNIHSFCFCWLAIGATFAQGNAIGLHATTTEYIGGLNNNQFDIYKFNPINLGGAISLLQRISPSFNVVEKASYNKVQYVSPDKSVGVDGNFFTLNFKLRYKFNNGYILNEGALLAPFLTAGLGGTYLQTQSLGTLQTPFFISEFKTNVAAGGGAVIRISEKVYLELASTFQMPLYNGWDGVKNGTNAIYLQHSAGFLFILNKKEKLDADKDGVKDSKDECPDTPLGTRVDYKGCPVVDYVKRSNDDDNDGVRNRYDECPNTPPGTKVNDKGCPVVDYVKKSNDDDNDGVRNRYDECPNTPPGTKVNDKGCPVVEYVQPSDDDDNDGVKNRYDECPNSPAGSRVNEKGCPVVDYVNPSNDNDGDGVPNNIDRCPNTYGPASNSGCPEVKAEAKKRLDYAVHGIYFETDKAIIKPLSYGVLNDIVSILQEYKDYDVRLGGHTDAIGSDGYNLQLSEARIASVKNYFISKGVASSRFDTRGFGERRPAATNQTVEGRAENRRVEIQLYLK